MQLLRAYAAELVQTRCTECENDVCRNPHAYCPRNACMSPPCDVFRIATVAILPPAVAELLVHAVELEFYPVGVAQYPLIRCTLDRVQLVAAAEVAAVALARVQIWYAT